MNSSDTRILTRARSLVERGERISVEDCAALFACRDLTALARIARLPRERRFGRNAFYRAVELSTCAAVPVASGSVSRDVVVRCNPEPGTTLQQFAGVVGPTLRSRNNTLLHVSPGTIVRFSRIEAIPVVDVIRELMSLGQVFVTGEEAELFDPVFRAAFAPDVVTPVEWLDVHRVAHAIGLKTSAAMSYDSHDRPAEMAQHLDAIRRLQDETGGFVQIVPMAIHSRDPHAGIWGAPTAGQSLRSIAVTRAFLDNVPHVAAAPALVTAEVAYVALSYGADTIETTVVPGDVRSDGYRKGIVPGLPVLEPSETAVPSIPGAEAIRQRLEESRWKPVVVDAMLRPAALAEPIGV